MVSQVVPDRRIEITMNACPLKPYIRVMLGLKIVARSSADKREFIGFSFTSRQVPVQPSRRAAKNSFSTRHAQNYWHVDIWWMSYRRKIFFGGRGCRPFCPCFTPFCTHAIFIWRNNSGSIGESSVIRIAFGILVIAEPRVPVRPVFLGQPALPGWRGLLVLLRRRGLQARRPVRLRHRLGRRALLRVPLMRLLGLWWNAAAAKGRRARHRLRLRARLRRRRFADASFRGCSSLHIRTRSRRKRHCRGLLAGSRRKEMQQRSKRRMQVWLNAS